MDDKNKWSPAPWKFTPPGPADANGYGVCALWGEPGSDEQLANAHLIAAAPEMYEELQEISNWMNSQLGMGDWHKDIEQLLAKARGETA